MTTTNVNIAFNGRQTLTQQEVRGMVGEISNASGDNLQIAMKG